MAENESKSPGDRTLRLECFQSDTVDRVRDAGGRWRLPGGVLRLPKVFGFCRGVERALAALDQAVKGGHGGRIVLLGEIIHNPWVNDFFRRRGVQILTPDQRDRLEEHLTASDIAIIPAFGVAPGIQRRLEAIGCDVVDSSCGDVRRLWAWAERAARDGYAVAVFGRPNHDETVVTKSRLAEAGGKYVVLQNLSRVDDFCRQIDQPGRTPPFSEVFSTDETNADSPEDFARLAQVSQTTMLYEETLRVRRRIEQAFVDRFGLEEAQQRLLFQPTVCRATQRRQEAAVALCQGGCDLVIVVGGVGSSNTRHLYELASQYVPAFFIEDARSILSAERIETFNPPDPHPTVREGWLPTSRPLTIGVLAGASCPEIVIGDVLDTLADLLR